MAEEAVAGEETASAPSTLWDEMTRKVVELVEKCPSPEKHCARSAIRHIEKAWAIKDIDPEMAAFRAITAEEEAATAICLDRDGRPLFHALLYHRSDPCFVAFDCLWLDGRDLRDLPLIERKRVLRRIIPRQGGCVQYLPHVSRHGVDLFREVVQRDLEGIVAKLRHPLRPRGWHVAVGEDQKSRVQPGRGAA